MTAIIFAILGLFMWYIIGIILIKIADDLHDNIFNETSLFFSILGPLCIMFVVMGVLHNMKMPRFLIRKWIKK